MTDPGVYFLTEDRLRARFDERVREFVFGGFRPQESPAPVLLGGQPAAGRSRAMAATVQRHGGTLVPLTGGELRPLHPRYRELPDEDAQTRETATAQFSAAMVRMSIEHALDNGYGLLLEGVFRDPAMTVGTAERFAAAHPAGPGRGRAAGPALADSPWRGGRTPRCVRGGSPPAPGHRARTARRPPPAARRPDASAARSRSTTTRARPAPSSGTGNPPSPGAARPPAPERRRGRNR